MIGMYLEAPYPHIYGGGLEKARLLASDAQIDAQNAPFNLQLVLPKLAKTLKRQCCEVYILRTMTPPSGTIFAKILSHTLTKMRVYTPLSPCQRQDSPLAPWFFHTQ